MTFLPPSGPFALLHREDRTHIEVLTGTLSIVERLADIPLDPPAGPRPAAGPGPRVLAAVPYRQIAERGFACIDDRTPLACLLIDGYTEVPRADVLHVRPTAGTIRSGGFDLDDRGYGRIVETVLRDEIGHGHGANFVLHRTFSATVDGDPLAAALAAFGRLLRDECGAYWTFLVHLGDRTLVGATPERHVTVRPCHAIGDHTPFDLVVPGPGPGDPGDRADPRLADLRDLLRDLLAARRPLLAVCLSHQVLADLLGLRLHRRDVPYQGLQREVDLFGQPYRVGFYSTFTALSGVDSVVTPHGPIELARDAADGAVHALRGPTFAGVQFHPESVLTEHGEDVLLDLLVPLTTAASPR